MTVRHCVSETKNNFDGLTHSLKYMGRQMYFYSGPVGARVIKEVRFQFFFFPVQQNAQ